MALFPPSSKALTTRSRYSKGGSHTVTQSTFASPCTALSGGVNSGPCVFQVPSHALNSPTRALIVNPSLVLPHRLRIITPSQTPSRPGSSAKLAPIANRAWFSLSTPHLLRRLLPSNLLLKVIPVAPTATATTEMDTGTDMAVERVDAPPLASAPLPVPSLLVLWRRSERFGVYGL